MRARPILLLLLLLYSMGAAASPDSLRRLEYFIDNDPGVGNGTSYTISVQRDTFSGTGISVSIPSNIGPGWHTLYVRSLADSAGYRARWGNVVARSFFVPFKLVAAEYFWDTDPGPGSGTALTISSPDDTITQTAVIPTTGLVPGWHDLYVRSKDSRGIWGNTGVRRVFVEESITSGEYFIDTDPGVGLGTPLTITTASDTVTATYSIGTTGLKAGTHSLYVRTRSVSGKWGEVQARSFYIRDHIANAEYFFDTDPGVGMGTPLTVSTATDTVTNSYSISTTGLPGGMHQLYVRTKDGSGRWGQTQTRSFYIREKIVAAEYFWDSDPGVGHGVALAVNPQQDTIQETYSLKAPCDTIGTHYLFVRTKDEHGRWGIAHKDTVTLAMPNILANASYPGPGPYGTPVKVLGSGGMPPYKYKVGVGSLGVDSVFLVPNDDTLIFTAVDTCGYSDTALVMTPIQPTIIAGGSGGTGSVTLDYYRYWTYVLNSSGEIIGAVRDYNQNLGTLTIDYLKNNSGIVRSYPFNGVKYLDRNWNISSGINPTQSVGIQLFAVDTEFNALATADTQVTGKNVLEVLKYDGTNEDLSVTNKSGTYVGITPDSTVTFTGATTSGNGYAFAFAVQNFSEFYESLNPIYALPLHEVTLRAEKLGKSVSLQWHTTSESATKVHRLQRGATSADLQPLATLPSKGDGNNDYGYLDTAPLEGRSYYRVMVEDFAGSRYYSNLVLVRLDENRYLTMAPNPANEQTVIGGLQPGDVLRLCDLAGHVIWSKPAVGSSMMIRTATYPAGMYMLRVDAADGAHSVLRLEIMR